MYNFEAIRAFLTMENPDYQGGPFHGIPVDQQAAAQPQDNYVFHVTRLRNLAGIMQNGLDPHLGGQGGAGALLAPGRFVNDGGWVFGSRIPEIVDNYVHEYDTHADQGELGDAPILLRFRELDEDNFEDDRQHPGAVKTRNAIGVSRLEMLTPDGWVICSPDVSAEIMNTMRDLGFA